MLKPSRLPLVLISSLVLVLPGCGSGGGGGGTSKADYEKQIRAIGNQFRSQVTATQGKVSSATDTNSRIAALDEFKNEFSSFADKIDQVKPPSGAQDEQDAVVSAFKKGAGDIGNVQSAVKSKDATKIRAAAATFQADAAQVQAALQKLRDAVGAK